MGGPDRGFLQFNRRYRFGCVRDSFPNPEKFPIVRAAALIYWLMSELTFSFSYKCSGFQFHETEIKSVSLYQNKTIR